MEQKTCSFCSNLIEPGTGKMYVKKDGTIYYFCSSKCQNNMALGRIPRRIKWARHGGKRV
ncbi:MAG: 50S ribosomal protein L24e [Methanosarcinales archaeon]|nr:50S ribosomal protein L24e [Methanosarcinales archaeon]